MPQSNENEEKISVSGWTPLFFAIASGPNGHPDIVNLLMKNGATVNVCDSLGRAPLHYASELG